MSSVQSVLKGTRRVSRTDPFGFTGSDSFTYTITNGFVSTVIGIVHVTVSRADGSSLNVVSLTRTLLSSFIGLDPNGGWTIFVADVSPISTGTLKRWTLDLTVAEVPEPSTVGLIVLAFGVWASASRRSRRR